MQRPLESQIAFRRLSGLLKCMPGGCLSANLEFASLLLQAGMQGCLVKVCAASAGKGKDREAAQEGQSFPPEEIRHQGLKYSHDSQKHCSLGLFAGPC